MKVDYNKWGYARCSTNHQDAEYEIQTLLSLGVPKEHIYIEYVSGRKTRDQRPKYDELMSELEKHSGAELYATDLVRLARNVLDMVELVLKIPELKIKLVVAGFVVDCRDGKPMDIYSEMILMVFGLLGNFQARLHNNIASIKLNQMRNNKDAKLGRPEVSHDTLLEDPKFMKYYGQWKSKQISLCEFQRLYGVKSRNTCYNHIHIFEGK